MSDQLQERAARLLAMALKAREEGHLDYAERLTQRASENLDQSTALERLGTQSGEKVTSIPSQTKTATRNSGTGRAPLPGDRAQAVAGDVRSRLLPAEHAAGMNDGRYTPNTGHSVAPQRTPLWANCDILQCGKVVEKVPDYKRPISMALTCRWRSHPQHQKRT